VKKPVLFVLLPILLVAAAAFGFVWWERGAPPGMRPTPVDVTVDTISRDNRGVRLSGTAHLQARLKQTASGTDAVWYLYPLLAKGDTAGREIHVMLRTTIAPNDLYGFEDRTVTGFARPPGRLVTREVREALLQKGYSFDEDFVLVEEWADLAQGDG
jgi:hypothetical protein